MRVINGYEVTAPVFTTFRLDGGAMFGPVPKKLWERWVDVDADNRILLAARALLLRGRERTTLVDVGMGEKWDEKQRAMFAVQPHPLASLGIDPLDVTDVILSHLHFDHAGGISRFNASGEAELVYPNATVHIQRENFETALRPNRHERASYLPENIEVLRKGKLDLIEGSKEVMPGVFVHPMNGHTRGMQYVEIPDPSGPLLYAADLIPTSNHLPTHFTMSYDMNAELIMEERERFLSGAMERNAIVVFEHDMKVPAATIRRNEKGYFAVKEVVNL